MTAFSARNQGRTPETYNRKDGRQGRPKSQIDQFLALGFTQTDWNKFNYTWEGDFPTFTLSPGIVAFKAGLVARYDPAGIEILFPYGAPPLDIKDRLDCEIFEVMQHDATVNEMPIDWQPAGAEIDIDDFMAGKWVRS